MHQGLYMYIISATTLNAVRHVQARQGALQRPQHRLQARCPEPRQLSALHRQLCSSGWRARARWRVRVCRVALARLQHCLKGRWCSDSSNSAYNGWVVMQCSRIISLSSQQFPFPVGI